jgi:hypothetical protein
LPALEGLKKYSPIMWFHSRYFKVQIV